MVIENLHPFEIAGLGKAPFTYIGMEKRVHSAAPGHQQPGGTCDACGQGIMYCFMIRSSDGRGSIVGCDCVLKLDRSDNKLVDAVQRDMLHYERKVRDDKRKKEFEEREKQRSLKLQEERDRNGGLTDKEVSDQKRKNEEVSKRLKYEAENGWLLTILEKQSGDFCASMVQKISTMPISDLSDRCIDILRDIFAKHHGRRGSKKYEEAQNLFDSKINISTLETWW